MMVFKMYLLLNMASFWVSMFVFGGGSPVFPRGFPLFCRSGGTPRSRSAEPRSIQASHGGGVVTTGTAGRRFRGPGADPST